MKKKKRSNKSKSIHTKTWSQFCVGQLLLGMGPPLECCYYIQWHSIGWKNPDFFSLWVSVANRFCVRGGLGVHIPISMLEFCLGWSCAGPVHLPVSVSSHVPHSCCVWKMLLPWRHPLPLALRIFLPPLLNRFGIFVLVYSYITSFAFWLSVLPLSYISQWYNFYSHRTRNMRLFGWEDFVCLWHHKGPHSQSIPNPQMNLAGKRKVLVAFVRDAISSIIVWIWPLHFILENIRTAFLVCLQLMWEEWWGMKYSSSVEQEWRNALWQMTAHWRLAEAHGDILQKIRFVR